MNVKTNYKVSVITATFNLINNKRKFFFEQMCDSVCAQTYSNIEHIIIDGASNDGTVELLKNYQNGRSNVIVVSEPDKGIYNAFNKGIIVSTGEFILFMNSDDYFISSDAISILINKLTESRAEFACSSVIIESKGTRRRYKPKLNDFLFKTPFCHQTMLVRKRLFEDYGCFDEYYRYAADYKFMVILLYNQISCTIIDTPLVLFRDYGISAKNGVSTKCEIIEIAHALIYKDVLTINEVAQLFNKKFSCKVLYKINKSNNFRSCYKKYIIKQCFNKFLRFRLIILPIEKAVKKIKRALKVIT